MYLQKIFLILIQSSYEHINRIESTRKIRRQTKIERIFYAAAANARIELPANNAKT